MISKYYSTTIRGLNGSSVPSPLLLWEKEGSVVPNPLGFWLVLWSFFQLAMPCRGWPNPSVFFECPGVNKPLWWEIGTWESCSSSLLILGVGQFFVALPLLCAGWKLWSLRVFLDVVAAEVGNRASRHLPFPIFSRFFINALMQEYSWESL